MLDTMLNVSKSVTAERGFITLLTTPKKSLAPLPEPVSVKGGSPELWKFTLLKIVPYEKSGLGYTFLVLNVLQ